jgi:cell division protein ZapA
MKQLDVQIMGQSYLLGCPEDGDAKLLLAVERVDAAMCKIRDGGKIKARDRIAVLAALNLSFDLGSPTETTHTAPTKDPVENDSRLGQILARLDEALSGDGQLI